MIKGLHHKAYRCKNSEETRQFYEDFLGLSLAGALEIEETKTGRETKVLHSFYRMDDGSLLFLKHLSDHSILPNIMIMTCIWH
jgi:catechol 2,3-dioxygenase-like lactoylglutathione lyase family enzyme